MTTFFRATVFKAHRVTVFRAMVSMATVLSFQFVFLPLEIAVFNLWFRFYPTVRLMRPSEVINRNPKNLTP